MGVVTGLWFASGVSVLAVMAASGAAKEQSFRVENVRVDGLVGGDPCWAQLDDNSLLMDGDLWT